MRGFMTLFTARLSNEQATARFGARLAPALAAGDVVALEGPLGAGKTTLARGLIGAFAGAETVPSPTFTLVETYAGEAGELWHFDLYRLEKPADVWELGLEDALADGICLIEWPDRIEGLLPEDVLRLDLAILEGSARRLTASGPEPWRMRLPPDLIGNAGIA